MVHAILFSVFYSFIVLHYQGFMKSKLIVVLSEDSVPIQWNIPTDTPGLIGVVIAGKKPKKFRMPTAYPTDGSVNLNNVPAFDWSFGCSATSAAMLAGYYDNMGLPDMYNGPTNNGVMPMDNSIWGTVIINGSEESQCPLSATRRYLDGRTIRGHVDDYWVSYLSSQPDPYITGGWTQHSYGECTGDYMKTNQSSFNNVDGETTFYYWENGNPYSGNGNGEDGCYGLRLFIISSGYTVTSYFTQLIDEESSNGFTFNEYKSQIDAGRPVLIHIEGHTMLGMGYNTTNSLVYVHDTWDYEMHEMVWGGTYGWGLQHWGVSVIQIQQSLQYNIVLNQANTIGTYTAANSVTMNPGFTTGTTAFTAQIFTPNKGSDLKILFNGITISEFEISKDYTTIYPDLWNGNDDVGNRVPTGEYQYVITKEGEQVETGKVTVE